MRKDFDIIVIGAGPAGSTFGRLISPSYKVCIIDPKTNDYDSYKKPCGGLLSPDAQKAFAVFNMTFPKDILVDPQIFSVKTIDINSGLTKFYQRFYLNFNRHKFDMWLKSLIPKSITVIDGKCMSVKKFADCYEVTYNDDNGNSKTITSEYIIGADGAKSIVRNTFYKKPMRKYIAIQQWFEEKNKNPYYSCIFDRTTTDCCSWTISKGNYFIYGGAFKYNQSRKMFETQKKELEIMGYRFGRPLKTEACLVMRPKSIFSFCTGKNKMFLIGEAGGFVSPSSLEGISSAVISAKKISDVFNKNIADKNTLYTIKMLPLILKLSLKLLKCPFMYCPVLRKLVMKSGIKSIKTANS